MAPTDSVAFACGVVDQQPVAVALADLPAGQALLVAAGDALFKKLFELADPPIGAALLRLRAA